MYICYIDESGTSSIPGNTSHFILAGLAIPIQKWKYCEKRIANIKKSYALGDDEIHTGWIIRNYTESLIFLCKGAHLSSVVCLINLALFESLIPV